MFALNGDIMAFDKNLDQKLFLESKEYDATRLSVGVYSYSGRGKKMQISRENRTPDGEWTFAKLGRLTKEEAEDVLKMMQKALKEMEKPLE